MENHRSAAVKKYRSSRSAAFKRAAVGGRDWSATFDFELEADGNFSIREGMYLGTVLFEVDDSGSNYYSGSGYVESVDLTVDIANDEIVGGSVTFEGDGEYTAAGACAVDELLSSSA